MRHMLFLVSALVVLTLLGLCATLWACQTTEGSELLKNPTFERRAEGWLLRGAVPEPDLRQADSACVRLDGVEPGPRSWSHAGVTISPVPADRELHFDCQVRGDADGQKASVNVFGYDQDRDLTFQSITPFDLKAGKWIKLTQDYVVPAGTTMLTAWVINETAQPISIADAHLRVGGPKEAGPRIPKQPDEIDEKPDQGKALAKPAADREPKPAELEWLRKNAITFKTDRAESGFDDLQPLKAIIGDARIVGLGEATHGTAEFFRMKHRLVEFLASEKGFTLFAIEANMPEAYRVNDYVLNGKGDPKALLRGMYFWTWDTQEVLDMILWMRKFNASGKGRIQFLGFDMQTAAVAAENARAFVAELDPAFAKGTAEAYNGLDDAIHQALAAGMEPAAPAAGIDKVNLARTQRVAAVLKHMEATRARYLEKKPAAQVDWAIQNARVAAQAAGMLVGSPSGGSGHRDRCMADNVDWILGQAPPGSKIVLWAHNFHVSKAGMGASMGSHLAKRHGKDYLVVGFAAHKGRYTAIGRRTGLGTHEARPSRSGSVEYYTHCSGLPRLIIDLRRASKDNPSSAWLTRPLDHRSIGAMAHDTSSPFVLPDEYDALIAFDDTTASKSLQ